MANRYVNIGLAFGAVMLLAGCPEGDDNSNDNTGSTNTTVTQPSQPEQDTQTSTASLRTFEIPVTRNGVDFNVDVLVHCAPEAEGTCQERIARRVQRGAMCDMFFLSGSPTNNPELRALSRGSTAEDVTDALLFSDEEVARVGTRFDSWDIYTITDIDNREAAAVSFLGDIQVPEACNN